MNAITMGMPLPSPVRPERFDWGCGWSLADIRRLLSGAIKTESAWCPAQTTRLLSFEGRTKTLLAGWGSQGWGMARGRGTGIPLLMLLNSLLNQHTGHVAHRARLLFCKG